MGARWLRCVAHAGEPVDEVQLEDWDETERVRRAGDPARAAGGPGHRHHQPAVPIRDGKMAATGEG